MHSYVYILSVYAISSKCTSSDLSPFPYILDEHEQAQTVLLAFYVFENSILMEKHKVGHLIYGRQQEVMGYWQIVHSVKVNRITEGLRAAH